MPRKPRGKRFATEAEESAWWEANEEALADKFEKAIAAGRVGAANLVITGDSTVTKIRLSAKDVARARAQASKRGIRCQEYLKIILLDGLRKPKAEPAVLA